MQRTTTESLLLSALMNSSNATAVAAYGVTPEYFEGFKDEFVWLMDYYAKYGEMPTWNRLETQFPGFPLSPEELDARWPAAELAKSHSKRETWKILMKAEMMLEQGRVEEAVDLLHTTQFKGRSTKPSSLIDDPAYFEDYENYSDLRVPVPYSSLQFSTNGIGPGELWYVASRLGQGKSWTLLNIACHAALKGQRVIYLSLEMSQRLCSVRTDAIFGHMLNWGDRIDAKAMLERTYDRSLYEKLRHEIADNVPETLDIHDTSKGIVTPNMVSSFARDYDLVIVDYVGLMKTDGGQRAVDDWRTMASLSNGLKEAAMASNGRVLAAVQINREGDTSHDPRPPKVKNLAQSDAIGQDGDVIITSARYSESSTVSSVEKNRNGLSGRWFWSQFLPNTGSFEEVDRQTADDMKADDRERAED